MQVLHIEGGHPLNGTLEVSGSKNACLPIFAATLLTDEPCIIENVPNLSDVRFMGDILSALGAVVEQLDSNTWKITAKDIIPKAPYELVRKMRASVCLMGPLLGRLGQCRISLPGGCVIGHRPIDLHIKGFTKMGCEVEMEGGYMTLDGSRMQTKGTVDVFMGGRFGSTVTGTANIIMAAVLRPGITRIEYAACEPEIVDLCQLLTAMGARIGGIGSSLLTIEGVTKLKGCRYRVIPDRIEAGTFLIAGLLNAGTIQVKGANAQHLHGLLNSLEEAGARLDVNADSITVRSHVSELKPVDVVTLPYPGFPTDLQAQFSTLMALTPGMSIITERIYPNRFMHIPELQRMGASMSLEGTSVIINGRRSLSGAPVMASDLRASASLFLAGLFASGETCIHRIYHLDRGYECLDDKFKALGARIMRLQDHELPQHLTVESVLN